MQKALWLLPLFGACATTDYQKSEFTVFEAGSIEVDGTHYPFQLLHPNGTPSQPQPLVVFLHGAGERGTDNSKQLTWLPLNLAGDAMRAKFPCYLLAVQCPSNEKWADVPWSEIDPSPLPSQPTRAMRAVVAAMDRVLATENVDQDRVYLTGLSMGGYGAFDLAMRMPERFAALVPVCGGGDPKSIGRLQSLPMWIWHGDADSAVPVIRSRQMHAAAKKLDLDVQYSELPGVGHDSWRQAYGTDGALDWMFTQRRTRG
ncbi:MAG: PHB depolymerase family esterase [Planctomycetota bacterium]